MRGPEQIASVAVVLYIVFFALSPPAIVRTILDNIVGMAVAVVAATYVTLYKSKVVGGLLLVALVLSMSRGGREGLTSGCTVSKANGYRYIGGDIPDSDPKVSSGTACGEACCANASCTKFTFIGGRCYLKTDAAYKGPVANTAGEVAEAGEVTRVASSSTAPAAPTTTGPQPWNDATSYAKDDVVSYNGNTYKSIYGGRISGKSPDRYPSMWSMTSTPVTATPSPVIPTTPPPSPPIYTPETPPNQNIQVQGGANSSPDVPSAIFQLLSSYTPPPAPITGTLPIPTPSVNQVETCSLEPYSNYESTTGNFASF
jgi:hypothetical protein